MAIQGSGAISFSDLQDEFGGSNPISLSEYYQDADPDLVTANNTNVPNIGNPISPSDFYGAKTEFPMTIAANSQEVDLYAAAVAAGWDGSAPVALTISSGVYIWSDDTSVAGLTISDAFDVGLTIVNNGYIIGKGGQGGYRSNNATAGGPAISNSATGVSLTNASSAFIAGGGGGGAGSPDSGGDDAGHGGGGAGGGRGGGFLSGRLGGAGGAIGQAGANGGSGYSTGTAYGGGAGGGGGGATSINGGGGGGGGRILGSGATGGAGGNSTYDGGAGGANGDAGSNQATIYGGGGGGGWGASGGDAGSYTGGSGGAAISGTSITVTNNGTIYGTQA